MKKFTPKELLSKTMPFIWAKLMLRLIAAGLFLGLFAFSLFAFTRNPAVGFVLLIASFIVGAWGSFFLVRVVGYGVRVGHIAVLVETIKTGQLPANQVVYGKNKVVERIGTAATFFVINKLVDRAVLQLQMRLQSAAGFMGGVPGLGKLVKIANSVLKVALKYVDECCVAWIFYGPKEQSAWKGALDGVTLYAQNWKKVLGNAIKIALMVMLLTFGIGLIIALIFAALLGQIGGLWSFFAFVFGLISALVIKQVFLDTWVMISMLVTFLEVAPNTQLKVDMYGKLSNISPAFRKMTENAQNEIAGDPFAAPAAPAHAGRSGGSTVFCGQCGAKNPAGTRFCGECGKNV